VTAAAHDASVLAVLAGTLLGVTGLDGMPHYVRTQTLPRGNPRPPAAVIQPTPCSQAYGQITANRAANGSPLPKFDGPHRRYGTCGYRLFAVEREFGFHGCLVTPRLGRCAT